MNERPRLRSNVMVREVEDDLILYDSLQGEAFLLNPMGAAIADLCDGRTTVREMVREIVSILGGSADQVEADVRTFLQELSDRHLLGEEP